MSEQIAGVAQWWDAADANGNATREFRLAVSASREVTGALWLPQTPRSGAPLVCFGHGASGDRYQLPICQLAQRLVEEACLPVLSLDGPVHGLRGDGTCGPEKQGQFIQLFISDDDCIPAMIADWNAAIGAVQSLPEVGRGKLAYFGLSMGSMLGMSMLAQREDVAVAVLGLVGADEGAFPRGQVMLEAARKIKCPVLMLMSMQDEIFSQERYLNVFEALGSDDKRLHANPGGHADIALDEIDYSFDFILAKLDGREQRQYLAIADTVPQPASSRGE